MTEQSSIDLLLEVRSDIAKLRGLLIGNGGIGLCEQVRNDRRDITSLTTTMTSLVESVKAVSEEQLTHRQWHNAPENLTIQQALSKPGILWIVGIVIGALALFGAVVGAEGAASFIKGLL